MKSKVLCRIILHPSSFTMKAIQFNATIPRYVIGLAGQKIYSPVLWNGMSCTSLVNVPEPTLPNDEWVKIKTRYGGICGTDTGTIHLHTSPYLEPFGSYPLTLGHESVGTVAAVGARAGDLKIGERVVVEPQLWCKPRGFSELCRFCARGEINLCERMNQGVIAAGATMGFCRDTGGSWSEYYLAHACQVYRVPEPVSDENAVLVEPFTIGLHAALQFPPRDEETVLIMGAGVIGLLTLAALRQTGSKANIWVVARYPFQAEAARKLGATEIIDGKGDYYTDIATRTGGNLLKPTIGKRVLNGGGVDLTFECVGNDDSIDDSLRLTRARGRVVIVSVPGIPKTVDWTPFFAKELNVVGSNTSNHVEPYRGEERSAFSIALELMQNGLDLSWLVTHKFKLEDYARAFALLEKRGESKALKAVFGF
jgi:threonine dehydrogenase-like Zn-dependent dehydrogenase